MKKFVFVLIFLLGYSFVFSQTDEDLIRECYKNYKLAILNDQGAFAIKCVDQTTLDYYSKILKLVKTADSLTIEKQSITDKIMILSVRQQATDKEIRSLSGSGLFLFAVHKGMVGKSSVRENEIGKITMQKNFAQAQIIKKGVKQNFYLHFYKENSGWKINLTNLFPESEIVFKQLIKKSGKTENEYIFYLLGLIGGKEPGPEIWKPKM